MKVTLNFNLPEEKEEHDAAMKGGAALAALHQFYNDSLRKRLKYQDLTPEVDKILEEVKEEFFNTLNEYDIDI